ncbi:MAG: hypothetical protein DID91_2727704718 [Candidatus Nitrotoga sp. MKT]|nr:MAG: hypothetical protein DID91_2727704718 [Candidatus Nitrotoga sp. MKT]
MISSINHPPDSLLNYAELHSIRSTLNPQNYMISDIARDLLLNHIIAAYRDYILNPKKREYKAIKS